MMYRYDGFMGGFEWLFMIVFWAVIIWAIIALIRHFTGNGRNGGYWRNDHRENFRDRENYRDEYRDRSRENYGMGSASRKSNYNDHDEEILKILKERYARGEITREEFEQKKTDLMTR